MRALPICLVAVMLSGCSVLSRSPVKSTHSPLSPEISPEKPKKRSTPVSIQLYTDTTGLLGKTFRDLGEVSGESCQVSNQDSPANISVARRHLKTNAAKMKANAVLLHSCEIASGVPGCYRQAICLGSALQVSSK